MQVRADTTACGKMRIIRQRHNQLPMFGEAEYRPTGAPGDYDRQGADKRSRGARSVGDQFGKSAKHSFHGKGSSFLQRINTPPGDSQNQRSRFRADFSYAGGYNAP
jgi:hypothetical protein